MKGISLTLENRLVFDKEFKNREEKREVNKLIGSLGKKVYKTLVFTMATLMLISKKAYAGVDEALVGTEKFGQMLLMIVQRVGFWVCVLGCILEIMVSVFKKGGGQKEILALVFKWLLIFASFYIVPWLFGTIPTYFN